MHIHIAKAGMDAKFCLYPEVHLAYNRRYDARTIKRLQAIVEGNATKLKGLGMSTLPPEPTAVRFDDYSMWVDLEDGRTIGVPLVWFPRLLRATPEQRLDFFLSPSGMHWDEIDEDISIAGLLAGRGDMTRPMKSAA